MATARVTQLDLRVFPSFLQHTDSNDPQHQEIWRLSSYQTNLTRIHIASDRLQYYALRDIQLDQDPQGRLVLLHIKQKSYVVVRADNTRSRDRWMAFYNKLRPSKTSKSTRKTTLETQDNNLIADPILEVVNQSVQTQSTSSSGAVIQRKSKLVTSASIARNPLPIQQQHIESLGLKMYLSQLPAEIFHYHVLLSKARINKPTSFLMSKYFQKVFLLFSPKSLYPQNHINEHMLLEKELPPWISLNTLYCFDPVEGRSSKLEICEISSIQEIKAIDKLEREENRFKIRIDTGAKMHVLGFDIMALRDKWIQVLNRAKINALETEVAGLRVRRNVDPLIRLLEQGALPDRLEKIYEEIRPQEYQFDQLVKFLNKVYEQLQEIVEACLAKQPQQPNLIKVYFQTFHEKIFVDVKLCWESNYHLINNIQIIQLLKWLDRYNTTFRADIEDDRFSVAAKTLLKILGRKTLRNVMELVVGTVMMDSKDNYYEEDGALYSNSLIDLFHFLNDSFSLTFNQHPAKHVARMLAVTSSKCITRYINSLKQIVDENELPPKQLSAIANNSIQFGQLMRKYIDRQLVEKGGVEIGDATNLTQSEKYAGLARIIVDKLAAPLVTLIVKGLSNSTFLNIDTHSIFAKIDESKNNGSTGYLYSIHQKTLFKRVFKEVVTALIGRLLANMRKDTKIQPTVEKLERTIEELEDYFSGQLLSSVIEKELEPLNKCTTLLSSDQRMDLMYALKSECLQELFSSKQLLRLIEFRSDLSSSVIKSLQAELMALEYTHNRDSDKVPLRARHKTIALLEDADLEVAENQDTVMPLGYWESNRVDTTMPSNSFNSKQRFIYEGYMLKKKGIHRFWERRYFRLRKTVLFWYADEESTVSQNQLDLTKVQEIFIKDPAKPSFRIYCDREDGQTKEYRLKCGSVEERDLWVRSLEYHINQLQEQIDSSASLVRKIGYAPMRISEKTTMIMDFDGLDGDDSFGDLPEEPRSPVKISSPRRPRPIVTNLHLQSLKKFDDELESPGMRSSFRESSVGKFLSSIFN